MKNTKTNLIFTILLSLILISCNSKAPKTPNNSANKSHTLSKTEKEKAFKPGYEVYNNERFQFSVEYPSDILRAKGESDNNEGKRFISADGSIYFIAYATYNSEEKSVEEILDATVKRSDTIINSEKNLDRYFVYGIEKESAYHYFEYMRNKPKYNINYYMYIRFPEERMKEVKAMFYKTQTVFDKSLDNNEL